MNPWRLLERPSLRPVWRAVHAALERNAETRSVRLEDLNLGARGDLQGLLGLPARPPERYRLVLANLNAALDRAVSGLTARQVAERLVGPVIDQRAVRADAFRRKEQMWTDAFDQAPEHLHDWLRDLSRGRLKRAATRTKRPQEELLAEALACATQLPASGKLLQVLASEQTGNPHALDGSRNLASLVLGAAASLVGSERPRSAFERRSLWAEVGILTDSLSSHVLVHGLWPIEGGLLAEQLRDQAHRGLPRKITLAELRQEPISLGARTKVHLIENPSIVDEAARRHGPDCASIICLDGEPTVAVWHLLHELRDCELVFHCDYDTSGIRIANRVFHRVHAQPCSYDAAQYRAAAERKRARVPLDGRVGYTPWDPALADAMRELKVAVFQEDLLEELVSALHRGNEGPEPEIPF